MAHIVEVSDLHKKYEYYKKAPGIWNSIKSLFKREKLYNDAVKNVSFTIEEGELVGFLGPNGAGKTTTLKMLSGILHPTSGEAKVLGYTPWDRNKEFQKQFAIVMGQKNQLWWDLPAMESFLLNKEIYGVPDKQFNQNLDELVDLMGIESILDVQVRKLSLGQRMKAEIIAALLHNPRVLFLDEPTIGLDVVAQQNMREFIKKYNASSKTTIMLTSHYMEDVERLCNRVIMIDHGTIIYDGGLKQLLEKYVTHKSLILTFDTKVDRKGLAAFGTVKQYTSRSATIQVGKDNVKQTVTALLKKLPVEDLLIQEEDLDSVIRHIFTEK